MYKPETINRVVRLMREEREKLALVPVDLIKICISKGNRKIGRVMNVSLPPIMSCGNCAKCLWHCYDVKACIQYPATVINARMRNYSILMRDRERYFALIEDAISRRRTNKFFRWHVAGDIVDMDYFQHMVDIAARHPDFVFWTYTKCYKIINEWCRIHGADAVPENLSVMYSEWRGMPMDNPYGFPEFRVVFKDEERPQGFYCPGNCDVCKESGRGCIVRETVYCMEH